MKHPDFNAAKKGGDDEAADRLVRSLTDVADLRTLASRHPGSRLVCVGTGEGSANRIPQAFAGFAAEVTGLPLDTGVLKGNSPKHTGKSAVQRFVARAAFEGSITTGANYIALDDVMTQGGTISELRQFLQRQGSRVVAVATLAFTNSTVMSDGLHIAPTMATRRALIGRFGISDLTAALTEFGIYDGNPFALTESEGRMLLRFESTAAMRAALTAAVEESRPELEEPAPVPTILDARSRHVSIAR